MYVGFFCYNVYLRDKSRSFFAPQDDIVALMQEQVKCHFGVFEIFIWPFHLRSGDHGGKESGVIIVISCFVKFEHLSLFPFKKLPNVIAHYFSLNIFTQKKVK